MQIQNVSTMVYFGVLGSRIEGRYFKQPKNTSPAVLILPPDPRYGGNISNKIVQMLEKNFQQCGFTTLAINYKGTCGSDGVFHNTSDGIVTASVALDWLQAQNTAASHFWIAGYSLGAYVAADIATRRPEIENAVFISPLIQQYDFSFMCPSLCDSLVVSGKNDEFIDSNALDKLIEGMREGYKVAIENIVIEGAGHRFDGKLEQLEAEVLNYINIKLATRIAKPVRKKRRKRQKKDTSLLDD